MTAEMIAVIAAVGVGLIAALFLEIVLFLIVVVTPTIIVISLIVVLSASISAWTIPTAWIAQQATYMLVLHFARPRTYHHVIERVRVMMKL